MNTDVSWPQCTAFAGQRCIAQGSLQAVAVLAKVVADRGSGDPVLVFDDVTGQTIELDLRGSAQDLLARLAEAYAPAKAARGRPRLGVVAREVTLLPRHWEWLAQQPGGASVALRKLVELASRVNQGQDRLRQAQEACYRFMSAMAGNQPGFEEALRTLFAGEAARFNELVEHWPPDVRDHARKLAAVAFAAASEGAGQGGV